MRRIPFSLALPLAFAATAGLAADSPLRPEQVRQAMGLKLGAWKTKTRMVDIRIEPRPGDDPAEAERAERFGRALMGGEMVQHQCLEDRPGLLSLPGLHPKPECEFTKLEVRNGRFTATSLCRIPALKETFEQTLEGRYGAERLTLSGETQAPHPRGLLRLKIDSESRFTGSCDSIPPEFVPGED